MAVSTAQRPTASARALTLTFLTAIILNRGVADVSPGASASEELPHRRFEYKYSFKGPHLSQPDGGIPFWIHSGSKFPAVNVSETLRTHSSCLFSYRGGVFGDVWRVYSCSEMTLGFSLCPFKTATGGFIHLSSLAVMPGFIVLFKTRPGWI